jgi:hypothetical protein
MTKTTHQLASAALALTGIGMVCTGLDLLISAADLGSLAIAPYVFVTLGLATAALGSETARGNGRLAALTLAATIQATGLTAGWISALPSSAGALLPTLTLLACAFAIVAVPATLPRAISEMRAA